MRSAQIPASRDTISTNSLSCRGRTSYLGSADGIRSNETTPVHHACRRRGGGVAVCCACAGREENPASRSVMAKPTRDVRIHAARLEGTRHIEGQNIRFEFRWAEGKLDQLPE